MLNRSVLNGTTGEPRPDESRKTFATRDERADTGGKSCDLVDRQRDKICRISPATQAFLLKKSRRIEQNGVTQSPGI